VDIPVGPTAKVRSPQAAERLAAGFISAAAAIDLEVVPLTSDGTQPVGRRIGPALEARDVLDVLRRAPDAPQDLRDRAITLAAAVLEASGRAARGMGALMAAATLDSGQAWRKFVAICEAQGGMRTPAVATRTAPVVARRPGRVASVDCRRLARVAKLAGAPAAATAGLELHVKVGDRVAAGQPLFTLHAESGGEMAYAMDYVAGEPDIYSIDDAA
jgi:thymidine phosphorylase